MVVSELLEARGGLYLSAEVKAEHSELRVSDQLMQREGCPPVTNHFSPCPPPSA